MGKEKAERVIMSEHIKKVRDKLQSFSRLTSVGRAVLCRPPRRLPKEMKKRGTEM